MLEGNFDSQLQTIFEALPEKKQTLLFSATITDTLKKLGDGVLNDVSDQSIRILHKFAPLMKISNFSRSFGQLQVTL